MIFYSENEMPSLR